MQPQQAPYPSQQPVPLTQPSMSGNLQPISDPNRKTARLNPFKHLVTGNKKLFATNLTSALLVGIATSIAMFVLVAAYTALLANTLSGGRDAIGDAIAKIIGSTLLLIILIVCIAGIAGIAQCRTIIASSNGLKVSFGEAIRFGLQRFGKSVLTFLVIGLIAFAAYVVLFVVPLLAGVPALAVIGTLALLVLGIIFMLRTVYVTYILSDDDLEESPLGIIKRSSALFSKSSGALVLYTITIGLVYIILLSIVSSATSQKSNSNTPVRIDNYSTTSINNPDSLLNSSDSDIFSDSFSSKDVPVDSSNFSGGAIVGMLVSSLVGTFLGVIVQAGIVNIYAEAKEKLDGLATPNGASSGPAPVGPLPVAVASAPMPVASPHDTPTAPTPLN